MKIQSVEQMPVNSNNIDSTFSAKNISGWLTTLLICYFIYLSVFKVINFQDYYANLSNQPFPGWLVYLLKYTLPAWEIGIVISLIITTLRQVGLILSFMMAIFLFGYSLLVVVHFYSRTPCSCFLPFTFLSWPMHLLLQGLMAAVSIYLLASYRKNISRLTSAESFHVNQ